MTTIQNEVMSKEEERAFTVFVTAVERYLGTVDDEAGKKFELWLDEHGEDEEMLAHLLQAYPKFGEMFADEIERVGTGITV